MRSGAASVSPARPGGVTMAIRSPALSVDDQEYYPLHEEDENAAEYAHVDLDHEVKRLWRLGPDGYEEVEPEANGRLLSRELELEFDLDAGVLQIYTPEGERLLKYEEEHRRRQEAEQER